MTDRTAATHDAFQIPPGTDNPGPGTASPAHPPTPPTPTGAGTVPVGLELPTQQSPADAFGFLGRPVGLAVPYLMWRFWNIELSLAPTLNTIGSIGSQEPDGMAQAAMSITTYVVEETIAVEPPAEMSNPT